MNLNSYSHQQRGFTLIEAIVVIVITGIIAGMVAIFIRAPVQTYMDVRDRADLADTASAALRKMRVDLRLALPNSIRVVEVGGVQYLELLLTKTGARYQAIDDGLEVGTQANPGELSFTDSSLKSFNYIGSPLTGSQTILVGDYVVVYNLGPGIAPADAYQGGNRALLTGVAGNMLTMDVNRYAQAGAFESPDHRFQVVTTAVTYRCAPAVQGGEVRRYWNYPIQEAQPTTQNGALPLPYAAPIGTERNALLAGDVRGCLFDYASDASRRSGVVGLRFSLAKAGGNVGEVTLFDQVHVDNTP
jgi:MSHA biogenesis protein MshO